MRNILLLCLVFCLALVSASFAEEISMPKWSFSGGYVITTIKDFENPFYHLPGPPFGPGPLVQSNDLGAAGFNAEIGYRLTDRFDLSLMYRSDNLNGDGTKVLSAFGGGEIGLSREFTMAMLKVGIIQGPNAPFDVGIGVGHTISGNSGIKLTNALKLLPIPFPPENNPLVLKTGFISVSKLIIPFIPYFAIGYTDGECFTEKWTSIDLKAGAHMFLRKDFSINLDVYSCNIDPKDPTIHSYIFTDYTAAVSYHL